MVDSNNLAAAQSNCHVQHKKFSAIPNRCISTFCSCVREPHVWAHDTSEAEFAELQNQRYQVHLVSYADGKNYEATQSLFDETLHIAGIHTHTKLEVDCFQIQHNLVIVPNSLKIVEPNLFVIHIPFGQMEQAHAAGVVILQVPQNVSG